MGLYGRLLGDFRAGVVVAQPTSGAIFLALRALLVKVTMPTSARPNCDLCDEVARHGVGMIAPLLSGAEFPLDRQVYLRGGRDVAMRDRVALLRHGAEREATKRPLPCSAFASWVGDAARPAAGGAARYKGLDRRFGSLAGRRYWRCRACR